MGLFCSENHLTRRQKGPPKTSYNGLASSEQVSVFAKSRGEVGVMLAAPNGKLAVVPSVAVLSGVASHLSPLFPVRRPPTYPLE